MSLLKLKDRLKTIKSLDSILSALQVVTMVRMRRTKEKHAVAENYLHTAKEVLAGRIEPSSTNKKVMIVITSNRGLCGGFNAQVLAKAGDFAKQNPGISIVTLGKRGGEYFRRNAASRGKLLFSESEIVERPTFDKIALIWERLFSLQTEIYVAYNAYQSTAVQVPKIYRLFPLPQELETKNEPADYILEPTSGELVAALFDHYLKARFFQLILDSQMGELAARLMVLKSAVDNSKELIENLVISINKARQASITRDLAEIIGSAEALRKGKYE